MMMMEYVFLYVFFWGFLSFLNFYKHFLTVLISLEFIVIGLFFFFFYYLNFFNFEYYYCLFYLVFSVCEGVLGLSILVNMIRNYGNDNFLNFSLL
uniref:NADH dehydrogenase subunit 4L n=1 Tax=Stenochironomus tobaduodecimus TaxID=1636530 RepID=UPI001FAF9B30|nr:NADH dehydrogenase subunit 4L [Stenochironomus tobaduodecimus]UKO33042.1 NADH dehydrogenase subunit 4L [Stenochironomus tobaduodecimus]